MKKLGRKVFLTIFGILTFFLIVSLVLINVMSYRRELESVRQNLNIIDDRGNWARPGRRFFDEPRDDFMDENRPDDENMMFGECEVYAVDIESGLIIQMFDNGEQSDFDPIGAAETIINQNDTVTPIQTSSANSGINA